MKAADTVGAGSRGYDAGKKINGRERHIAVDTLDLLLAVVVTSSGVQDRDGAHTLPALLRERFTRIRQLTRHHADQPPAARWGRPRGSSSSPPTAEAA